MPDDVLNEMAAEKGIGKANKSAAQRLIALTESLELFYSSDGDAYARVELSGHYETMALRSGAFKSWLAKRFYETHKGAANAQAIQDALNYLDGRARYEGGMSDVHVRVARVGDVIWLDLCGADWAAVKITKDGWSLCPHSTEARFFRPGGMLPLPTPQSLRPGESLDSLLRPFINCEDQCWPLVTAWILSALSGIGPYLLLAFSGEQGSAKTTSAVFARGVVDPNIAPLRSMPRDDQEIAIAALSAHVIALDNVSAIPTWLSDALCRVATGGALSKRRLYFDKDEVLITFKRPLILTSIPDVVEKPDLRDRHYSIRCLPIPDHARRTEAQLWDDWRKASPMIMAALLDILVAGLRAETSVKDDVASGRLTLPRMADAAQWVIACYRGMGWDENAFLSACASNRKESVLQAIGDDPVADGISKLMANRRRWEGQMQDLLLALCVALGGDEPRHAPEGFPRSPRALRSRVDRAKSYLRQVEIVITFPRGHKALVVIEKKGEQRSQPPQGPRQSSIGREGVPGNAGVNGTNSAAHQDQSVHREGREGVSQPPSSPGDPEVPGFQL